MAPSWTWPTRLNAVVGTRLSRPFGQDALVAGQLGALVALATAVAGAGRLSYMDFGPPPLAESLAWEHISRTGQWLLRLISAGTHLTRVQTHDTP